MYKAAEYMSAQLDKFDNFPETPYAPWMAEILSCWVVLSLLKDILVHFY